MKTININFDKGQLEEVVKKVIENIMKEDKKNNFYVLSDTACEEPKEKLTVMYLEVLTSSYSSKVQKVYFGNVFNAFDKTYATDFDLSIFSDLKKVNELKNQGWKEEVVYK